MPKKLFEKGNPGGPGRPKGSGCIDRCRKWADEHGFKMLEDLAQGRGEWKDADESLRLHAAEYLINRGYGKPTEHHDVTSNGESITDWLAALNGTSEG